MHELLAQPQSFFFITVFCVKAYQNYHDMYLEYYYYRTMHFLNVHGQASENCWDADKRNAKYLIKKKTFY